MRGELDSHEEVILPFAGPGEIKRREVSWTLTEKVRLPFAGPGEIKRREVVLDPQAENPGEIKSREVELGSEGWTSFASVVLQQTCYGHCPCDCSARQLTEQQLRIALVAVQWRGPHCLNIAVVLAVVHGLLGLSGERAVEPLTASLPPHP